MSLVLDGSNGVTFPSGAVANNALMSGTSQATTSGTAITFTGIPSWVKRITVMFNGVSTSGSSDIIIQIGSGSFITTGYNSACMRVSAAATFTTGFGVTGGANSASYIYGGISTLATLGSNIWVQNGIIATSSNAAYPSGGNLTLSGVLDRIQITTVNGTDTFDAGSINIQYE